MPMYSLIAALKVIISRPADAKPEIAIFSADEYYDLSNQDIENVCIERILVMYLTS